MKIKIYCDNGANIHSKRCLETTVEEIGLTPDDWNAMSEEAKHEEAKAVIDGMGWVEIWYEQED